MNHALLKSVIYDQHEFIRDFQIVPRNYEFEENGNYVLVGLRRAGKSTLLYKIVLDLVASGVDWEQIIYINFEDERLSEFTVADFNDLLSVQSEMSDKKGYFFLDEVQNIDGWEKFARRMADAKEHIYITGSNAKMLSREIETTLGGRFFTKHITPYAFGEYLTACEVSHDEPALLGTKTNGKIRAACACPEADVQFISGGTQSNAIVIASMLQRWQGVVAAATGHVAGHEAGAIEYTGHKVITLPQHNGKLDAAELRALVATFYADDNHDHMVFPGMVYISHPSEYGTLYTKQELEDLHAVCQEYRMPLFLDGARLGYGLMAEGTDVTLADIARLTDVFYIGGTKVGALCGEAVVFPHGAPAHFMTMVKQQGALLAKGRLLGIQFDVLFTDDLYTKISKNAIDTANALKKGLAAKGYRFFMDSPTNQVFVILDNAQLAALEGRAKFGFWEKFDDTHTVVRIATSWATRMEEIEQLIALM